MRAVNPRWLVMVLVCDNQRAAGKTSCGSGGGSEIRRELRDRAAAAGLRDHILVSTARCLGVCAPGLRTIAVWSVDGPRELWVVQPGSPSMDEVWSRVWTAVASGH